MKKRLTHVDRQGKATMVDISRKKPVTRRAVAEGKVFVSSDTQEAIRDLSLPKGNPFEVARLAGIQAAKQAASLIPLCHNINLDFADVQIVLEDYGFSIRAEVKCRWATGVEMEALTAVSVAALTLYDMCKAVDPQMVIGEISLVKKTKSRS